MRAGVVVEAIWNGSVPHHGCRWLLPEPRTSCLRGINISKEYKTRIVGAFHHSFTATFNAIVSHIYFFSVFFFLPKHKDLNLAFCKTSTAGCFTEGNLGKLLYVVQGFNSRDSKMWPSIGN